MSPPLALGEFPGPGESSADAFEILTGYVPLLMTIPPFLVQTTPPPHPPFPWSGDPDPPEPISMISTDAVGFASVTTNESEFGYVKT